MINLRSKKIQRIITIFGKKENFRWSVESETVAVNTELECCSPAGCHSSLAERLCAIQAVLCSIPGGDQIIFIPVLFKKVCDTERKHLMVYYMICRI